MNVPISKTICKRLNPSKLYHAMKFPAKVRKEGKIVIPKPIRDRLGLAAGDEVDVDIVPAPKTDKEKIEARWR